MRPRCRPRPITTTGFADVEVVDGNTTRDVTAADRRRLDRRRPRIPRRHRRDGSQQLDQLAYDIATSFNSVSTQNAAPDGTTGHAMFIAPTQVAGAAASLEIDPSLAADPANLALAAAGGGTGDNTGGLALFALSNQTVASGGTQTLTDASLDILGTVGSAVSNATTTSRAIRPLTSNLSSLQDSLSGVDTNEELANLSKFQNTSEAMTKFVSTVNDMLTNLIQSL